MQIKSIVAAAGVVLLVTAGAAQADEVLIAAGGSGTEGFSTLIGVTAVPLTLEESTAVYGRDFTIIGLLDAYPPDPVLPADVVKSLGLILLPAQIPQPR